MKTLTCIVLAVSLLATTGVAEGAEPETSVKKEASAPKGMLARKPWRGSSVTLHNEVSGHTFNPAADLTYNPYWSMSLLFNAQWWFTDIFYVRAALGLSREMTNADDTTDQGETWLNDLSIRAAANRFYTIPVVDIDLTAYLTLKAPTSKYSQARSLLLAVTPTIQLSRRIKLLKGMNLSYRFSAQKSFHQYTTAQRDVPLISGCASTVNGCSEYFNTGSRNTSWRLSHSALVSQQFTDWLAASISFGVVTDFLYESVSDPSVSHSPMAPQDQRYLLNSNIDLTFTPIKSMSISVGASSYHSQLDASSSYQTPFFNRYTTVYLDLGLDIAGLISQISEG